MKALLGVDVAGDWKTAAALFESLRFSPERLELLHAVEPIVPTGGFPGFVDVDSMEEILHASEDAGRHALALAAKALESYPVQKRLILGDSLHSLLEVADEDHCDLIAITTHAKSTFEAFVTGSVTRGLLTASKHSFLAAKASFNSADRVTAIFATDHSSYANRALRELLRLAPAGISRMVVATVLNDDAHLDLARDGQRKWDDASLESENESIVASLKPICDHVSAVVLHGETNASLKALAERESANLLILGAQGHGFMDRVRHGSVSFHQVVAEPVSTLVLRP